jgi:uncharacterized membrane protein
MKKGKYRIYKAVIAGGLAIAISIAIGTESPAIALAAVLIAIAVSVILERNNKEITRDERTSQISWKATTAAFNCTLILGAGASLGIALFHNRLPENIVFFGSIMGYYICFALLIQLCFYAYFSRKQ